MVPEVDPNPANPPVAPGAVVPNVPPVAGAGALVEPKSSPVDGGAGAAPNALPVVVEDFAAAPNAPPNDDNPPPPVAAGATAAGDLARPNAPVAGAAAGVAPNKPLPVVPNAAEVHGAGAGTGTGTPKAPAAVGTATAKLKPVAARVAAIAGAVPKSVMIVPTVLTGAAAPNENPRHAAAERNAPPVAGVRPGMAPN